MQTQTTFQNFTIKISQWLLIKKLNTVNYFLPGPNQDNDKRVSAAIIQQLQRDFKDVFTGIGCFDGLFALQVKPDSKPYLASLRFVDYALQKPIKEELE